MKRTLIFISIISLSGCMTKSTSTLETRFIAERGNLTCFAGPTSEESCGGTGMSVFLKNNQIRHLDWTIETSAQFIRRQYYFDSSEPRSVVETISMKQDNDSNGISLPKFLSSKRYQLNTAKPTVQEEKLLTHAQFLIEDFKNHRKDFHLESNNPPNQQ